MLKQMMWIIFCSIIVSGCAWMDGTKQQDKHTICNELNKRIIFNGATGNQTLATQQRAEMDSLAKNYREEGCQ